MKFKHYVINRGMHRSGLYFAPHYNKTKQSYFAVFSKDCVYEFNDEDQFDVNKLFGLSFGLHHNNSARFGWRSVGHQIELSAYCYVNKNRVILPLGLIDIDKSYKLELVITDDYYIFNVYNEQNLVYNGNIRKSKTRCLGYKLFPYFGGNRTAPHTMHIMLNKIN